MRGRLLFLFPQIGAVLVAAVAFVLQARAAEVIVRVAGVTEPKGDVGCALFVSSSAASFPMNNSVARQVWLPADPAAVTCRFADVQDGRYAVSVSHDRNGNRKIDTNLFGIPTEAWGVSNNARPSFRAPRFDEASFKVDGGSDVVLEVKVAK